MIDQKQQALDDLADLAANRSGGFFSRVCGLIKLNDFYLETQVMGRLGSFQGLRMRKTLPLLVS
jgi:hypothetical protein